MLHELSKQTDVLLKTADEAVNDACSLHDRLDRSRRIQEHNIDSTEKFRNNFCSNLSDMKTRTKEFLTNGVNDVHSHIEADKELLNLCVSNQGALRDMTHDFTKKTNELFQTTLDVFMNQVKH